MINRIAALTFLVRNYDEAIHFFTGTLEFSLLEDTPLSDRKRWVIVAPPNSNGVKLLLAQATTHEQENAVGNQAGGRVFLFLHTDNFQAAFQNLLAKGVRFIEEPRHEAYGSVAVFLDLYGNKWDLIQPMTG